MNHDKIIQLIAHRNNLKVNSRRRYASGWINFVYDLNEKYIIKIQGDLNHADGILKPQAEITGRLLAQGAKVPKIFDAGEIMGKPYLLMEKLSGTNLVYDWLKFSLKQRENFMAQLAEQLKIFHSLIFDNYAITISSGLNQANLREAVRQVTDFKRINRDKVKKDYLKEVDFLEKFYLANESLLNEEKTGVLVHNDIHLENIFYQGNKITGLIDLDWVCQAPKDYELRKLVEVFYDPKKTVEKQLEPLFEGYQMTKECGWLKKYYPQLFEYPNLITRIKLFSLDNLINKIVDYQNGRWSEQVMINLRKQIQDFYRSDWLEKLFVQSD